MPASGVSAEGAGERGERGFRDSRLPLRAEPAQSVGAARLDSRPRRARRAWPGALILLEAEAHCPLFIVLVLYV